MGDSRTLGLDIGDRRIGVALSDPLGILASPYTIIDRHGDTEDIETISRIISEEKAGKVIIGLPRSLDGTLSKQAEKVKSFVEKLGGAIAVPVEFRDERLTTVSAKRFIREARTRKHRRKVRDDAVAAAILLQSYLDEVHDSEKP